MNELEEFYDFDDVLLDDAFEEELEQLLLDIESAEDIESLVNNFKKLDSES